MDTMTIRLIILGVAVLIVTAWCVYREKTKPKK